MTAPNGADPSGAINVGHFRAFQVMTQADAQSSMTSGAVTSIDGAQGSHQTHVDDRIDGAYTNIAVAQGTANTAVTDAQAAANAAASAAATAASAQILGSYWEAECVVASAGVVLGVNELLIGLCQNVPTGLTRKITDMHIALLTQPNGIVVDTKKWNSTGTSSTVIHTATLAANVVRTNYSNLNLTVTDKERVFWNVTSVTGSTAPVVLQILLFGTLEQ